MDLGLDFLISTLNQSDHVLQDFKKSFISVIVPANVQKECALIVACVFLCDTHRDIGRLYSVLVRDGRVHMNQAQEVEAQRWSQTTQQPEGTKKEQPDIMMRCETVRFFLLKVFFSFQCSLLSKLSLLTLLT